jgi:hypothetical protein
MRGSVSLAYKQATKAQESEEAIGALVTFEHDDLLAPIRLTDLGGNIVSRGNTYLACFIQATILDDDPDRPPEARLIVSNINRTIIAALRSTMVPATVTLEIIRASDPDYIEAVMPNLEMRHIGYDAVTIQGALTPKKIKDRPAIDYCFTPGYFPGLF